MKSHCLFKILSPLNINREIKIPFPPPSCQYWSSPFISCNQLAVTPLLDTSSTLASHLSFFPLLQYIWFFPRIKSFIFLALTATVPISMADFPPNLEDGESWLPSDVFLEIISTTNASKVKNNDKNLLVRDHPTLKSSANVAPEIQVNFSISPCLVLCIFSCFFSPLFFWCFHVSSCLDSFSHVLATTTTLFNHFNQQIFSFDYGFKFFSFVFLIPKVMLYI